MQRHRDKKASAPHLKSNTELEEVWEKACKHETVWTKQVTISK